MTDRSTCADAGHCWHESDGKPHQRHSARPQHDTVTVHCCWCPSRKQLPIYSQCRPGKVLNIEHGERVAA